MSRKVFKVLEGKSAPRRVFAVSVYDQMHSARNDFIHGNPVRPNSLYLRDTKIPLWYCAALLYRLALTSFLDLSWRKPLPPASDVRRFAKAASDRYDFEKMQGAIEKGLHYAVNQTPTFKE